MRRARTTSEERGEGGGEVSLIFPVVESSPWSLFPVERRRLICILNCTNTRCPAESRKYSQHNRLDSTSALIFSVVATRPGDISPEGRRRRRWGGVGCRGHVRLARKEGVEGGSCCSNSIAQLFG